MYKYLVLENTILYLFKLDNQDLDVVSFELNTV